MGTTSQAASPRALVIGAGSIGQRHARLLAELGCEVRTVSRRSGVGEYESVGKAIRSWAPSYVVVATETGDRHDSLAALVAAGYDGRLLVEKPLGVVPDEFVDGRGAAWVGYNLRFHPVIAAVRSRIQSDRVLTVQARAGQFLPDWRPGRDYRTTASNRVGGGVLRDLSHEIDLLEWLVGPCRAVSAITASISDLDLVVEDVSAMLMRYERAPVVTLELNYFDRVAHRTMTMTTNEHVIEGDLIAGTVTVDGTVVDRCSVGRDDTYLAMHGAILSGQHERICTLSEGRQVMRVLHRVEQAADAGEWISI